MAAASPDRELLLQAIRRLFTIGFGLMDSQVIVLDNEGHRPTIPYLALTVLAGGTNTESTDWITHNEIGGTPRKIPRGYREAQVSVNAYGLGAEVWVDQIADVAFNNEQVIEDLRQRGVTIVQVGPPTNLTALVDASHEYRSNTAITCAYEHVGSDITIIELLIVEVEFEGESPTGSLSITMTETIDPDNPPC